MTQEKTEKDLFLFFLIFSRTDPDSCHPHPILLPYLLTYVPILCPKNPNLWVYLCFISFSLCVICFLPFSHLHLDCTLKQKQKCSTSMTETKESTFTLGVDELEKPAEVILYQEHDVGVVKKGLVHIQTVVRNCTISFICI